MKSERKTAQIRHVYAPGGESIETLVLRYLAMRAGTM